MQERFTKQFWISFAIVGGSIVAFSIAIWIFAGNVSTAADKIVSDRTLMNERVHAGDTLALLKSDEGKAAPYEKAMGTLLPTADALLSFPEWIDGVSRVSGVTLTFNFSGNQTPSSGDAPGFIGFSFTASGGMDAITNFLERLESKAPKYLVTIDSIDAVRADTGYRVSASGRVFTQ